MMKFFLFLLMVLVWVPEAPADHHRGNQMGDRGSKNSAQSMTQPKRLLPATRPGISNKQAASLVMERYAGSRVLGVNLMDQQGAPIYKVRTLSSKGVVRSVFVDGHSGEVFE